MRNIFREKVANHYILVHAKGKDVPRFLRRVFDMRIAIYDIDYLSQSEIAFKMLKKDFKKLRKNNRSFTFRYVNDYGFFSWPKIWKKYKIVFLSLLFGLVLGFLLTHIIVKVDVIHSNKEIRELVTEALEESGIKRLTWRKSYQTIDKIKKDLLEAYPDRLEWIEIERIGMSYRVHIEERIITAPKEEKNSCHIVAKKDAIITRVVAHKGLTMKNVNQYVKKGDIIVSGNILVDNEIKGNVCAAGEIYGEVWYTVSVSIPFAYEEKIYTGKVRHNFYYETKNKQANIFRDRLEDYSASNKKLFRFLGVQLYYQTQKEYVIEQKIYKEEEALAKALKIAKEKMAVKLDKDERVLSQKVLKKTVNDSTMNLDVFISVEEKIGEEQEFRLEAE